MTLPPRVIEYIDEMPTGLWSERGLETYTKLAELLLSTGKPEGEVCELLADAFDGAIQSHA